MARQAHLNRQDAIKQLILKETIADQKQLVERLSEVYGLETNQAAVSRDLHKLGVVKKLIRGTLVYEVPLQDTRAEILKLAILKIENNETTIVITTYPGLAAFVGDCLDHMEGLEILGCLAGENVVFVIPTSIHTLSVTANQIKERLHYKQA